MILIIPLYICVDILFIYKPHLLGFIIHQNIMATGSYTSANLTKPQLDLMLLLDEYEMDIFSLDDVKKLVPAQDGDANELIENLVHKKVFSRIERGKYCRANFRDEKVIGSFLVPDGAIAYWSALNLHGLTEQFPNTIFVQTTKIKKDKKVFGTDYKFVTITERKRDGISNEGYGNHSYAITDEEKTLVDCFDIPKYSGGYAELIRAFSKVKLSSDKMIRYCTAVNNIAATKRMGFLAELFKKPGMTTFIRYSKQQVKQAYNPFDSQGPDKGDYERDWRLRMNISREELMGIANKIY